MSPGPVKCTASKSRPLPSSAARTSVHMTMYSPPPADLPSTSGSSYRPGSSTQTRPPYSFSSRAFTEAAISRFTPTCPPPRGLMGVLA